MPHIPTSFDPKNSHRLVHFFPETAHRDLDRVEDLLADGLAAARQARDALAELPYEVTKPVAPSLRDIASALEKRRLLDDNFWDAARAVLLHLARRDISDEETETREVALRRLREALNLSERVGDLIAAEREIGWHRGIRL